MNKIKTNMIQNKLLLLTIALIYLFGCKTDRLDLTKIAIAGHSYGGATAIFASSLDNRIKSCFVLDGWFSPLPDKIVTSGLDIPLFCIGRPSWDDSDYPSNYKNLELLLNASTSQKFHVFIKNSLHLDFTDIPLFSPVIKYVMDVGKNSPEKSIKIQNLKFLADFIELKSKKRESKRKF